MEGVNKSEKIEKSFISESKKEDAEIVLKRIYSRFSKFNEHKSFLNTMFSNSYLGGSRGRKTIAFEVLNSFGLIISDSQFLIKENYPITEDLKRDILEAANYVGTISYWFDDKLFKEIAEEQNIATENFLKLLKKTIIIYLLRLLKTQRKHLIFFKI